MNLSQEVKKRRKMLNLTQEQLSLRVGVGLRFLRELEQGKKTVRLDKVLEVLNYLGLELKVVELGESDE